MPIVQCPRCRSELDVDGADIGHKVECPQCQAVFPAVQDEDHSWRRRDLQERDDEERERRYEQRQRDRELDPRDRTRDLQRAEDLIAKPANGMIWTCAITILLGLVIGGILAVVGWDEANNGVGLEQDEGVKKIVWAVFAGILAPIYHAVMLFGALKAKKLEGSGWGMASAIMGIVTIVLCGPCTIVSCFSTGYGIWMIVTLAKPEVKKGLRWNTEGSRRFSERPHGDDDAMR